MKPAEAWWLVNRGSTVGDPLADAERVRFASEPILAWRTWMVHVTPRRARRGASSPHLAHHMASYGHGITWPPRRPMRAHCLAAWCRGGPSGAFRARPHQAPGHVDDQCGIYAVKSPALAERWGQPFLRPIVRGTVYLWGRVLEFESGYRAEYAYPAELWVVPCEARCSRPCCQEPIAVNMTPEALASDLARLYGVPVHVADPEAGTVAAQ